MYVPDTQAYSSLRHLRDAYVIHNKSDPAAASKPNAVNTAGTQTTRNQVTGMVGEQLSPGIVKHFLEMAEEIPEAHVLSDITRRHLDRIANDPAYAAKEAKVLGTYGEGISFYPHEAPKNGDPASVWIKWGADMDARMAHIEQTQQQRINRYNELVAEGKPAAEIYTELLKFNADLPTSYGEKMGFERPDHPGVSYSDWFASQRDYLLKEVAQTGHARLSPDEPASKSGQSHRTEAPPDST